MQWLELPNMGELRVLNSLLLLFISINLSLNCIGRKIHMISTACVESNILYRTLCAIYFSSEKLWKSGTKHITHHYYWVAFE